MLRDARARRRSGTDTVVAHWERHARPATAAQLADLEVLPARVVTYRACADDTAEVIRHRLDVFTETTSPLIDYYRDRGTLVEVDGDQPPESITADIQARLPTR